MAKPQNRIPYLGVGGVSTDTEQEPWMTNLLRSDLDGADTLQDVVQHLDRSYDIEGRPVLYVWDEQNGGAHTAVQHPDVEVDDEAERTGYQALVNPAWEASQEDCPQNTPVWHIATDEYTPVSPMAKYGPLTAALRGNGSSTHEVFGEVRVYRNGGEIHVDTWFPGITVELGGTEYVMGVTSGYDYFGGTALYAEVVAAAKGTGTQMRGVTDKRRRSHRGAAGEAVADWWSTVLQQCEQATDALAKTVAEAQAYEVDFSELPITSEQYLLGLFSGTQYLAEQADERLAGGRTPDTCTAWDLYDAMAATLTQDFDGKDGSAALRKYLRGANEQLFSPPAAERTAADWLADWDELEGQTTLDGESVQAALREHRLGLSQAVKRYEDTKNTLKRMLNEIDEDSD